MKNPYQSGQLDQKVIIIRSVATPDGFGGNTLAETEIDRPWAMISPQKNSETLEHQANTNSELVNFVIRMRADLTESDFILWRGIKFNIRGIPSYNPRYQYLQLQCERGVGVNGV